MGGKGADGPQLSPMMSALVGGITGAIEISLTYPTEYLKTCMQLYPDINKKGMVQYSKETWANKGLFGKIHIYD
jgi:solute carrier family 25 (mitochondrial citrate transporter), member 1